MVKFSKQLQAQLIPEWKGAFVNYWQLKKDIKRIKNQKNIGSVEELLSDEELEFGIGVGGFCSYLSRVFKRKTACLIKNKRSDEDVIVVKRSTTDHDIDDDVYETQMLQPFDDQEAARAFFARLDGELNKVNHFYKTKEAEFCERGETLRKQMQVLMDLKAALRGKRLTKRSNSSSLSSDDSNHSSISSASSESFTCSSPPPATTTTTTTTLSPTESEKEDNNSQQQETGEANERKGATFERTTSNGSFRSKSKKDGLKTYGGLKSSKGRHVRLEIPATNASRTVSAITQMLWEDIVNQSKKDVIHGNINKKKVQQSEKMIRAAFVELYRGLTLLKTYSSLNMVAFGKILKKFDKVSGQRASSVYLKTVERSYFNSSDKAIKLADEIEATFTKNFVEDDRKKAMKFLKPVEKKDSHAVTFFIGLFTGCFVALFAGYAIMAHLSGIYTDPNNTSYVEIVYPVFSAFALLSLHIFLYGCNIFSWTSTRINYSFIFEFSPRKELKYRDVFLMCSTLMTVVVGAMVIHLTLHAKGYDPMEIDAIPGLLLLAFVCILLCPLNVLYKSTRFSFLKVTRNIVLAPLYKVVMTDFFMADQFTSQIPLMRHLEYIICYYMAGSFKTHEYGTCSHGLTYRRMAYVISFLPYYWRAMQCARRWIEEGDINQLANLGKYVSAMVAAGVRLTFAMRPNTFWFAMVLITSMFATIYQLYWDFVKDWGLLNPHSNNPWLRDELILKRKYVYFVSIGVNFFLRLAWLQTVMHLNMGPMAYKATDFALAALEVIRRGHWNYYRLENEHLNNVGKFRAVKTVPLPFHELESN